MPFVRRLHCKDSFLGADGVSPPPRWDKHGTGSPDWTVNGANNYVTLTKTSVSAQSCNFWRATAQRDDLSIEFSGYVSQWTDAPTLSVYWWATATSGAGLGSSYEFVVNNTTVALIRWDSGVATSIGSISITQTAATWYYWLLEWDGSVLTVYRDTARPSAPSQATSQGTITDSSPQTTPANNRYFAFAMTAGATSTEVRVSAVKVYDTTNIVSKHIRYKRGVNTHVGTAEFDYVKSSNVESPSAYWDIDTEFEIVLFRNTIVTEDVKFWGTVEHLAEVSNNKPVRVSGISIEGQLQHMEGNYSAGAATLDAVAEAIIDGGWGRKIVASGDVATSGTSYTPVYKGKYALDVLNDIALLAGYNIVVRPSNGQLYVTSVVDSSALNFDLDAVVGSNGRVTRWKVVQDAHDMANAVTNYRGTIASMNTNTSEDTTSQDSYGYRQRLNVDKRIPDSTTSTTIASNIRDRYKDKPTIIDVWHLTQTQMEPYQSCTVDSTDLSLSAVTFICIEQEWIQGKPMRSRLIQGSTAGILRPDWSPMARVLSTEVKNIHAMGMLP